MYRSLSNKDKKTWSQLVLCLSLHGFTEPHLPPPPPVTAQVLSLFANHKDEGLAKTWDVRRASNGAN